MECAVAFLDRATKNGARDSYFPWTPVARAASPEATPVCPT